MALAKRVINDLSVEVLEYPEITTPEQGLKNGFMKQLCYPKTLEYRTGFFFQVSSGIRMDQNKGLLSVLYSKVFDTDRKTELSKISNIRDIMIFWISREKSERWLDMAGFLL